MPLVPQIPYPRALPTAGLTPRGVGDRFQHHNIITRTSHCESFTMSGTVYNDNAQVSAIALANLVGCAATLSARVTAKVRQLEIHGVGP